MYRVSIEKFEGPFDLLLELVEAKKMPLLEISLARIAEQFVDYLKKIERRDLQEVTDFLVVASRLLLLKSRELVPSAKTEADEAEGDLAKLQRQLSLYRAFRRGVAALGSLNRRGPLFYDREAYFQFESVFYFPGGLTAKKLYRGLKELLGGLTLPQKIPQAQLRKMISFESCLAELEKTCAREKRLDFSGFIARRQREEKLVHFLGALELWRLGKIEAEQKRSFGIIILLAV